MSCKITSVALASVLGLSAICAQAGMSFDFKPKTARFAAPREIVALDGEWECRQLRRKNAAWERHVTPFVFPLSSKESRFAQEYRRSFTLPGLDGRRAILHAECIPSRARVVLNGETGFVHEPGADPFDVDVTAWVRPGPNDIFLDVSAPGKQECLEKCLLPTAPYVRGQYQGYLRPMYVELRPVVSVEDVTIRTVVTPQKRLTVTVAVTNASDVARTVALRGAVGDFRFQEVPFSVPAKGGATTTLVRDWPDAALWNPETPNLHFLDLSLIENGTVVDAIRECFGFREIRIDGDRLLLNGNPMMLRRGPRIYGMRSDDDIRAFMRRHKARGVNGLRTGPIDFANMAHIADEEGFFLVLLPPTGGKARVLGTNDVAWANAAAFQRRMYRYYKNHPSILCWGISNEFGSVYGLRPTGDNEDLVRRQQALGAQMAELDPTRPWTAYGDIEVGWPIKGPGPAPIRSFHYPMPPCGDRRCLPEMAWWYKKGQLSWQGISTPTKPLSISEDLYHGFVDQFFGISKWAGDSIFTLDGYLRAWREAVRLFADGYYDAGIACWEIWATNGGAETNYLYDGGVQLMPDFLISLRETFANSWCGAEDRRRLSVYSRMFLPRECRLTRTVRRGERIVQTDSWDVALPAGGRWDREIAMPTPESDEPVAYRHEFALVENATRKVLAERTYELNVFPRQTVRVPAGCIVLSSADSLMADVGMSVSDAVQQGGPIVVDRRLTAQEGGLLRRFVLAGGKVFLLNVPRDGWAPARLDFDKPQSFVFRRQAEALPGVTEGMLRIWRPRTELGDSGYAKDGGRTMQVLLDSGHARGLDQAQALRLFDGDGHWFLCQLPISRSLEEPSGPFVLGRMLEEFARDVRLDRALCVTDGDLPRMLTREGVSHRTGGAGSRDIMALSGKDLESGAAVAALREHVAAGGTGFVFEALPSNDAALGAFGLSVSSPQEAGDQVVGNGSSGLLSGISNQDLFFSTEKLSNTRFAREKNGVKAKRPASEGFLSGVLSARTGSDVRVLTAPGAIADVRYGKGRLVVTSICWERLFTSYPDKAGFLLRTLMANLGANVTEPLPLTEFKPVSLAGIANAAYWDAPDKPGRKVWFGDGNDMRYFPVNLCGFSPDSQNLCPVEKVPETPMSYAGVRFRFDADPRAVVLAPGEKARVKTFQWKVRSLRFLGALESNVSAKSEPYGKPVLRVRYGYKAPHEADVIAGDHVNGYRWSGPLKSGKVAWTGPCRQDPSAALYTWSVPVEKGPKPYPVAFVEMENVGTLPIAVVALSLEKDAE